MRIKIINSSRYEGENIVPGEYELISFDSPTERQNKCFHALLHEFWRTGQHSYDSKSFLHFRELIKLYLGAGSERYYSLVDDHGYTLKKPEIKWRVKSWSDYTKKERQLTIDNLISEMMQAEVQTPKFYEILQGMEEKQAEREKETLNESNY